MAILRNIVTAIVKNDFETIKKYVKARISRDEFNNMIDFRFKEIVERKALELALQKTKRKVKNEKD